MPDSDDEYVEELSDEEPTAQHAAEGGVVSNYGTRSKGRTGSGARSKGRQKDKGSRKAAWEDIQRSWEGVAETAEGQIEVSDWLEAEKRRRTLRDARPLQRGIIRHMMLVLDMSFAMTEKDLLPTRYLLTLKHAMEFVREFYEQNPISQLGIVGMRDGVAVRISEMSGNPTEHVDKLKEWYDGHEPTGNPSLQNALEMCRGVLFHAPSHGTREVLIISGALISADPGDIHDTIKNLIADRIRVSIVGLAAQVAICAELCSRTNQGDESNYAVAMHEEHLRELFLAATAPPVTHTAEQSAASLLLMGFPSRTLASKDHVSLCLCHNRPTREGYLCTCCSSKVCRLPAECPSCGLTLIFSYHLARSYHHLFPLMSWTEVSWAQAASSVACYACLSPFPPVGSSKAWARVKDDNAKGVSESGRYACQVCGHHFCIDCDVYAHEVTHNCPGCQSDAPGQEAGLVVDA